MKVTKQELCNKIIQEVLDRCSKLLVSKQTEYAPDLDPLANFKKGAQMSGMTEEQVLWMYCLKHLVSVRDIVFQEVPATKEVIREKTGDIINYMVLLNCIVAEKENDDK